MGILVLSGLSNKLIIQLMRDKVYFSFKIAIKLCLVYEGKTSLLHDLVTFHILINILLIIMQVQNY